MRGTAVRVLTVGLALLLVGAAAPEAATEGDVAPGGGTQGDAAPGGGATRGDDRESGKGTGSAPRYGKVTHLAPGVGHRPFNVTASHGKVRGHVVTVDLAHPRAAVGLLTPRGELRRAPVARMAAAHKAVAGVNGDFFDLRAKEHPGVEATASTVGPVVVRGRPVKGAVPEGQRYGPHLVSGVSNRDVFAVGKDGRARTDRLTLYGTARTDGGPALRLRGLNQYALPEDGVGAYTPAWGAISRRRAACGTDKDRQGPCSRQVREVTVNRGTVARTSATIGKGRIPRGSVTLVGRDAGAEALRHLRPGDRVRVSTRLASARGVPPVTALGGYPLLRGGVPLDGLGVKSASARTAVGIGAGGRRLHLLALEGRAEKGKGLTFRELADVLARLGDREALAFDGGRSSAMALRLPGSAHATPADHSPGSPPRTVPNGLGVFTLRER